MHSGDNPVKGLRLRAIDPGEPHCPRAATI